MAEREVTFLDNAFELRRARILSPEEARQADAGFHARIKAALHDKAPTPGTGEVPSKKRYYVDPEEPDQVATVTLFENGKYNFGLSVWLDGNLEAYYLTRGAESLSLPELRFNGTSVLFPDNEQAKPHFPWNELHVMSLDQLIGLFEGDETTGITNVDTTISAIQGAPLPNTAEDY